MIYLPLASCGRVACQRRLWAGRLVVDVSPDPLTVLTEGLQTSKNGRLASGEQALRSGRWRGRETAP